MASPTRPDWLRRLGVLRRALDTHQLDALVISSLVNIRYHAVALAARSTGALASVEIERIAGPNVS